MKDYKYLIIGGGMTADAAVKGIREVDTSGTIGVISAELDPPYSRPPLSKDLWNKNDSSIDDIWCGTQDKGAELFLATRAVDLDTEQQKVVDDKGEEYGYERLLLATGGSPKHLKLGSCDVACYRTLADYRKIRDAAKKNQHFVVLGGGFIGAEMAAALRNTEQQVTMVFPEQNLYARLLPAAFATLLNQYYEDHGVMIMAERKISSIDAEKDGLKITLDNDHMFVVDNIVAGIGIEPETRLAETVGIEIKDGIVVDDQLRTSKQHVYAAGDVANFYNPLLEQWMRVEHEDNALTMGAMAGRNMAGAQQAYTHLPYFYSDLFDLGYEAIGATDPSLDIFTDLKSLEDKGFIFYLKGQRVRGIVFWNIFGKLDEGRKLIAMPAQVTEDDLRLWTEKNLSD